jgi:hypothetical protein
MRVRLTRRLASSIDGVNLGAYQVGDVLEVTRHDADLLIAEEWAVPVSESRRRVGPEAHQRRAHEQRRAEDRVREERRDSRETSSSETPSKPPTAD